MVKKIYLGGGADIRKGESDEIDKKALNEADNKNVLIINLTTNDKEKIISYRNYLDSYFNRLGAKNINFVSELNNYDIKNNFESSGFLYIPGGDTQILIDNIKKKKLDSLIKNFKGIIMGNSAGAMILCNESICANEGREIMKGLGLVSLAIDVHYEHTHDKRLKELSKIRDIYAIPEKSLIVLKDNEKIYIGDMYLFSKGEKTKIN